MQEKHTKGPLRADNQLGWWEVLDACKQRAVAAFEGAETDEENKANAILFSAASELLEELKHAFNALKDSWPDNPCMDRIRAVIAKTEGAA